MSTFAGPQACRPARLELLQRGPGPGVPGHDKGPREMVVPLLRARPDIRPTARRTSRAKPGIRSTSCRTGSLWTGRCTADTLTRRREPIPGWCRCTPWRGRRSWNHRQLRHLKQDLVFPWPGGGYVNENRVKHPFRRIVRRAGLPTIRFHDMRHSFASNLAMRGTSLYKIGHLLGHKGLQDDRDLRAPGSGVDEGRRVRVVLGLGQGARAERTKTVPKTVPRPEFRLGTRRK